MQFYFIRHAQSINNALYVTTGASVGRSEDPELTDIGLKQAELLAEFLSSGNPDGGNLCGEPDQPGFGITHLYCSLMVRSVATGTYLSKALGLPLHGWIDLHEQGGIYGGDEPGGERYGLPGKDLAYFQANYPDMVLPDDFIETGWWDRRAWEKIEESRVRAGRFLENLRKKHGGHDDRVAVISHGGFFVSLFAALLDLPPIEGMWFRMNNTGITRIDFNEDWMDVIYQNRMDHLPPSLVT